MLLLIFFQTGSVIAQLAGANIIAHGALALMGGNRQEKQEKIIDQLQHRKK